MKVAQINTVCGYGSTGRIALSIAEESEKAGIKNYVLYGSGTCEYEFAECIEEPRVLKWNILKTRLFGKHGFYSKTATKRLLKRLDAIQPDIIHLHNIHGHYLNVKLLFEYIKKNEIKTIWTLHDCWAFTGHCAHFDYIGCEKWKTGCFDCKQKKAYPVSWFFDRSRESYKEKKELFCGVKDLTIVTPSQWLCGKVQQSFLKEYPVLVINNGIDLEKFKPQNAEKLKHNLGIENKKIVLGIAFNLHDKKGGAYLIELAKLLEPHMQMVILGLSTEEQLAENITVLPRTNSIEKLAEIYSMADIFVNPTLEDTFPTVNIEALACGTPVITFDTGGSPEIIDDETGIVVEKENLGQLFEAVKRVLGEEHKNWGKTCRNRAERLYRNQKKYQEYIDLYRNN